MSRTTNNCGNCAFGRSLCDQGDKKHVMCIFGGKEEGPFYKAKAACIAYVRRLRKSRYVRKTEPQPEPEYKPLKPFNPTAVDTTQYVDLPSRLDTKPEKAVKPEKLVKPKDPEWTPEKDAKLTELFMANLSNVEISNTLGMGRIDIANRIKQLKLKRPTPSNPAVKKHGSRRYTFVDGNNLPLSQQKYPNVRCCRGSCCKYKHVCQHHLHWLEMGKPELNLIQPVSRCINSSHGPEGIETTQVYSEYLGLNGETTPDPITFAESC